MLDNQVERNVYTEIKLIKAYYTSMQATTREQSSTSPHQENIHNTLWQNKSHNQQLKTGSTNTASTGATYQPYLTYSPTQKTYNSKLKYTYKLAGSKIQLNLEIKNKLRKQICVTRQEAPEIVEDMDL